jgi:hypothetical protein
MPHWRTLLSFWRKGIQRVQSSDAYQWFSAAQRLKAEELAEILSAMAADRNFSKDLRHRLHDITKHCNQKITKAMMSFSEKLDGIPIRPEQILAEAGDLISDHDFVETLWRMVDLRIYERRLLKFLERSENNQFRAQDTKYLYKTFTLILNNALFEETIRRRIDGERKNHGYEDRLDLYNQTIEEVYRILLEQHAGIRPKDTFQYCRTYPSIVAFASQVAWRVVQDAKKKWIREMHYIQLPDNDVLDYSAAQICDPQPTPDQALPQTLGLLLDDGELWGHCRRWLRDLSKNEGRILFLFAKKSTVEDIANRLGLLVETVLHYLRHMRRKFKDFLQDLFKEDWGAAFERTARFDNVRQAIEGFLAESRLIRADA